MTNHSNAEMRQINIQAAYALLMAAILNRDLVGAMAPAAYASMPGDIRRRLESHVYQTAFDALPDDIRTEAQAMTRADPDVAEARQIHAGSSNQVRSFDPDER